MRMILCMCTSEDTSHPVQCLFITIVTEVEQWTDTDMDPKIEDGRSSLRMMRNSMLNC